MRSNIQRIICTKNNWTFEVCGSTRAQGTSVGREAVAVSYFTDISVTVTTVRNTQFTFVFIGRRVIFYICVKMPASLLKSACGLLDVNIGEINIL